MSSRVVMKAMIAFYLLIFFAYLFGPLAVMGVTAFNTPNYPQAYPFEAFTTRSDSPHCGWPFTGSMNFH